MKTKPANSKAVFQEIKSKLTSEDREETHAIALALMENYYGLTLTDVLSERKIEVLDLSHIIARLNLHEPLQYIIGKAEFFGRKFQVDPSVLIPRPETELLVHEIMKTKLNGPRILDIGTGSGCIAITLNLEIPNSKVYAVDVSPNALDTATANSKKLSADVQFMRSDFLTDHLDLESLDIVVSNPPYIKEEEKQRMKANVLDYEPHQALFVPDNDPLLFYRAIASKGRSVLKPTGKVFVEINENFGSEVLDLFESAGFTDVHITKDMDGKNRIVIAQLKK